MPILNWIGKEAVVNHDKEVPFRLLKKVKSLSYGENSQNLIIHGDNLEALKALMPYYQGQVKCIYIDPPYNTGNEGWVYNDKVNSPKIKKWLGKVVGSESEDLCRHDKWLCMMYPRLKLLKDLLSDDGVIFVSIDDNEYVNLKQIMDEIFDQENFITNIVVKMSHLSGVKMTHKEKKLPKIKEYVLFYAKNREKITLIPQYEVAEWKNAFERYKSFIENKNSDIETWTVTSLNKAFELYGGGLDFNSFCIKNADKIFRTAINRSELFRKVEKQDKFSWHVTKSGKRTLIYKGEEVIFADTKLKRVNGKQVPVEALGDIWLDIGINNLANEGGIEFRFGKKPLKLIKRIISLTSSENDIVLDSFAGSGTTGHAVLQLNKENNQHRRFILVEMEDKVVKDITLERIKNSIKEEKYAEGFEFCELDKPLFNQEGQIEQECTFEQLATYIYFTETNTNIDRKAISENFIGGYNETEYYLIFKEKGKNVLSKEVLKMLQKNSKRKVIYADKCLIDERTLEKHKIQFKQIPYEVKVY